MTIVNLYTGLFPDGETVVGALACSPPGRTVVRVDLCRPGMEEGDWDRVLDALLTADLIVST